MVLMIGINLDRVTVGDCLDNFKFKNKVVLINDGQVVGFKTEKRKSTTNNADQS